MGSKGKDERVGQQEAKCSGSPLPAGPWLGVCVSEKLWWQPRRLGDALSLLWEGPRARKQSPALYRGGGVAY